MAATASIGLALVGASIVVEKWETRKKMEWRYNVIWVKFLPKKTRENERKEEKKRK